MKYKIKQIRMAGYIGEICSIDTEHLISLLNEAKELSKTYKLKNNKLIHKQTKKELTLKQYEEIRNIHNTIY
jgi:hypothetical protein